MNRGEDIATDSLELKRRQGKTLNNFTPADPSRRIPKKHELQELTQEEVENLKGSITS